MTISVQINPNLRVAGDCTVADLDEDVHGWSPIHGRLMSGVEVTVYEPHSGLIGRGWLVDVDEVERTVTIKVEWGQLQLPANTTLSGAFVGQPNMSAAFAMSRVA